MITIILTIVLMVIPLVILIVKLSRRTAKDKEKMVYGGMFVVGSLCLMVCIPIYMTQLQERANLEATYYNNIQNYQVTITETTSYLSQDEFINQLIAGSVEKINLGEQIAIRISEWRDSVNSYNIRLNTYKTMSGNIFTGLLYPKLSSELKMLTISVSNSSQ